MRNFTKLLTIFIIFQFYCVSSAYSIGSIFTVSNLDDSGAGSLRQAIIDANAGGTTDGANPHIIDFTLSGQIDLMTELPAISNHITINGHADGNTIHNNSALTEFRILAIGNFTVELNNLVLSNAVATADVSGLALEMPSGGVLTLNNCAIVGTRGTGQAGRFGLALMTTNVTVAINNSTFYDNTTTRTDGFGGITFQNGTATLTNVTISDNTGANGAGLFVWDSNTTLVNSTVVNNTAGTGAGGIRVQASGTLNLTNTIVANNTGSADINVLGSVGTNDSNLVETCIGTCSAWTFTSDPNLASSVTCGLQTYFPLNSSSDAINNGNDVGTPTSDICGTDWFNSSTPNIGSSAEVIPPPSNVLDFDGTDDYVAIGSPASLQITGSLTYEGWINTTNVGFVFGRRTNDTAAGIASNFEGGGSVQFVINDGSTTSQVVVGSTLVNDGEWHHIAAVYVPGTSLTLYIDGNQEDQLTTSVFASLNAGSLPFNIGAKNGSSQFFNGEMDEIRIWNVARTHAQIINNMGNTLTSETGLVASYDFNVGIPEGTNTGLTTLPDVTGNGNDGTLTNFALAGTTSNWVAETGDYNPDYSLISKQSGGTVSTASNHGLTFTDISYLNDDGDEILFSSQSTSTEGSFTDDINTNVLDSRWERDWYITITDVNFDGGIATMTFDFDALGLGTPTGKYALLYRENTSSQYVLTHVNPDIVGNTVSFKGNIGSISDGYYTIGNLTTVSSTVLYVNENAGGSADGTSWSSAFNDLEEALAITGSNVEIWVAKGTYTPSDIDREASFRIVGTEMNNLSLLGGFVGNELSKDDRNPNLNNTILSGDLFYNDNDNIVPEESTRSENSLHVIYVTNTTGLLIDGFTITGGNADDNGGGIINFATIDIKNCTFEKNTASGKGAGLWFANGSSDLVNLIISNNHASVNGGGMYAGGNHRFFNSIFENNMAQNGAGLYLDGAGHLGIITNNIFTNNIASGLGGAINVTFNSSIEIINNTIYSNSAATAGGGIYISSGSDSPIKNNIIWDNNATTGDDVHALGTSDIDYNLISSGAIGMNGNSTDPMFTDINNGDFSLVSGSGAINKGDNNSIAQDRPDLDGDANILEDTPFDFAGNSRVQGGSIDIGALEADPFASTSDNYALDFDGVDDYVVTDNFISQSGTFTWEAWIRTSASNTNFDGIIGGTDALGGSGGRPQLNFNSAGNVRGSDGFSVTSTTDVEDGQWHHVAIVANGTTCELYIDGILEASSTITSITYNRKIVLGIERTLTTLVSDIDMDEVRIWDVARTENEIVGAMNSTLTGLEAGLVLYYQFEDQSGTRVTDISTSGNDGTLIDNNGGNGDSDTPPLWIMDNSVLSGLPATPSDLFTLEVSDVEIEIAWTDNSVNETAFKIERSIDGGTSYTEVATVAADAESYTDSDVSAGNGYWYRVRALNEQGYSIYSKEKFATTFAPPHNALYFDGTDDYISVTDTDDFSFGDGSTDQSFSAESWVKFDNINSAGILSKRAGQNEWHMATSGSGEFSITLADQSASAFLLGESTGVTFNTGQWYHLAFTYDGSSTAAGITLYIDGVEPTTSPSSSGSYVAMENTTSNLEFGTINSGASFNFNGQMDEVRIWDGVRTLAEIQNNMFSSLSGIEDNLVAYYKFDQGVDVGDSDNNTTFTTLPDRSTNQNDGTLNNFTLDDGISLNASNWLASGAMNTIAPPIAPSGLFAVNIDQTQVNLSWTDNSDDESNFEIQRSEVGGSYTTIATVGGNTVEYIDHSVIADKSYIYHVRAVNQTGNSAYSSESYASTYNHPGNALNFDGTDDYTTSGTLPLANVDFTLEIWARHASVGTFHYLFGMGIGAVNQGLHIGFNSSGNMLFNFYADDLQTAQTFTDADWHHWAFTYDASNNNRSIFRDGILVASDVATADFSGTGNLLIGSFYDFTQTFHGEIDEIRIWSEARTVSDIRDRMNERLEGTESNLVAYYTFDQSLGTLLPDHSETGGNHGTLSGLDFSTGAVTSGAIAPSDLQITQISGAEVQLSWTGNVIDETSFIIDRSILPDFSDVEVGVHHAIVGANETIFSDNAGSNAQYFYRVQAERAGSIGTGFSNSKFGSTLTSPGNALNFDGVDDFVNLGTDEAIKPFGDFTIELWIKPEATAEMTILSNRQSSAEIEGYAIKTTADGNAEFLLALDDNSTWDVQLLSDAPLNQDQWYHIAVTFTSGTTIMYLNGTPQGGPNPASGSPYYASEKVRIGGDNDGFYFDGVIDELRFWSANRTQQEIQDNLYNDFPDPTTQTNLEAYYKFDQGLDSNPVKDVNTDFTTLPDRSIGNNNGTLNNFTLDDNTDDNVSNWIKSGAMNSNTDPVAATDVFARLNDSNEIELTWTDNATDENSYEIVRSSKYDMSSATSLAILPANSTTFTDKTVSATTQYYYRVDAVNQKSTQPSVPEYVYFYENSAGQALDFDGTDDVISMGSPTALQITGALTYEAWIKPTTLNYLFGRRGGDTAADIGAYFEGSSNVQFVINNGLGTNQFALGTTPVNDGKWHHIAGVYNPGVSLSIYIDGVLENQFTISVFASLNANTLPFHIGANNGTSQWYDGEIDEIRIWSEARSEAQIQTNMFNSLIGDETNLVAYYKFDQLNPTDDKLTDRSKNTNDGDWFGLSSGTNNTPNWVASGAMAPEAPSDLYTEGSDGSTVLLHWTDNSAIETSFVVERSTDPDFGSGVLTFEVGANATNYTDNDFETESGYFYRVRAVSPTGESENSNVKWGSVITGTGNALNFDGVDDFINLGTSSSIDLNPTAYSFESWVKWESFNTDIDVIIGRDNGSGATEKWLFGYYTNSSGVANKFTLHLNGAGGSRWFSSNTIVPEVDRWYHVAFTVDNNAVEFYLDGENIGSTTLTGTFPVPTVDIHIGEAEGIGFIDGELDEMRIWNSVRSESEIQTNLYRHFSDVGSETNLTAYYRFNQGNASEDNTGLTLLPDRSKNQNNGTLAGFGLTDPVESNWVFSEAMAPVAPSDLFAEETGTNEVTLTWTDNSSNEVEFKILRSTDLDVTENVTEFTVGANVASFIDNTLVANTGYFYSVEALTESLGSGSSNVRFASSIKAPGNALDFDGIDDYVNLGDPSEVDFGSGNFTIELWFKPNSLSNGARNLVSKNEAGQRQFELQFDRNFNGNVKDISIFYYLADDSFAGLDSDPNAITDMDWHHIAALRNGNNFEIYLDGTLIKSGLAAGSINGSMASTTSDLHIGASSLSTPGSFVDGQIDEVRIWSDVRTLGEIQSNMFHTIPETEPNLVAYYRFDQGKDGIINLGKDFLPDRSVNQIDGMLTGFDFGASDVNISNWAFSGAMVPAAPYVFNATQVTTGGFTADFTAPSGATDIIIDVDDNSDFSSLLATGISSGTSGSNPINVSLTQGTQYYYRARADHNGTLSENVVSNSFMVQPGNALDFDGTNDYINLFEDDVFAGDFTVEAWVKINELTDYSPIITKQATTSNSTSEFNLQVQGPINGNISFFMGTGSGIIEVSGNNTDDQDISPDTWTHVAATVEGTSMSLYINGTLSGSATFSGVRQNSTAPVQIGRYENAIEQYWPGQIDEVRIWNFALTESDIQRDFYATLVGNNTGLMAYYQFDETTGLTLPDVSVNNNDGSLTNMTGTEWTSSGALTIPPFTVVNTDDSGQGSLRQAIIDANASGAKETILFDILGNGPWNIELQSPLPSINNVGGLGMVIDGTSQPGWDMDAGLMVTLDGTSAGGSTDGLDIDDPDVEVYGLYITNFGQHGIGSSSGMNNFIVGAPTKGNVISGNGHSGLFIFNTDGGLIQGNRIGTSMDGLSIDGNSEFGMRIASNSQNITIGGDSGAGEGNLISGNAIGGSGYAIQIDGADNIDIYGNLIGVDKNGDNDLGNQRGIIATTGADFINIGASTSGHQNVIAGSQSIAEVYISGTANDVIVDSNIIGLNSTGNAKVDSDGSSVSGVLYSSSGTGTQILNNVISGMSADGIYLSGTFSSNVKITNNLIGTNSIGTATGTGLANLGNGIRLNAASGLDNSTGSIEIMGNVISGNGDSILDHGINLTNTNSNIFIVNNKIGVETDGVTDFSNTGHGISFSSSTTITEVSGNTIAYNDLDGIFFDNQSAVGANVGIGTNSYFCNVNDAINFENIPTVDAPIISTVDDTGITGTSAADDGSTVDIYEIDPSCADNQGASYVGFAIVQADNSWAYGSGGNPANTYVATVTDLTNGISEFSAAFNAPPTVVISTLATDPTNVSPFEVTMTFNEVVTSFITDDIIVGNGSASNINTGDNIVFTADITPSLDGTVTVEMLAGTVVDLAGNPNDASNQLSLVYDGTLPIIDFVTLASNNSSITIDFTEGVYANANSTGDLIDSDFNVSITGGVATLSSSSVSHTAGNAQATFTLSYTGTPNGNETISIVPFNGSSIYDQAGNTMEVTQTGNTASLNDELAPTLSSVSIGLDPSGNPFYARPADAVDIAFTSSEDITNISTTLLSGGDPVTNTGPDILGGPTSWNIRYAPTGTDTDGIYTFTIDFEDLAGNAGAQVTTVTDASFVIFDQTAPIISSTSLSADNLTLTINFDEGIFSDQDGLIDVALNNFSLIKSDGVATISASSINILSQSQVEISLNITGVPDGAETITVESNDLIYDGAGNSMDLGQSNNVVTLNDEKTPILSGLGVGTITDNYVDIYIEVDETSTLYYVLTQSMDQPTFQQILDGHDEFGSPAISANSYAISGFTGNTYPISGLDPSTSYYVYWAAEDAAGNRSLIAFDNFMTADPPVDLTFTTISVPDIPLGIGSNNNLIYAVSMEVAGGTANSIGITFTPNGTYSESDFTNFHFYQSVGVDDFGSATLLGSNGFSDGNMLPLGDVGLLFEETYTDGTVYWYITADVAAGATIGNTFGFNAPNPEENFGLNEPINPMDGGLLASSTFTISDITPPSGYSVTINNTVVSLAESLLSFDINTGELGAVYEYEISSSADGNTLKVTGSGTISDDPQLVNNIDVSTLADGELLVSVILKDAASNAGAPTTDTVVKDVTVPSVISITPSLPEITDADVGSGTFSIVVVYNEPMDIGINTPEITFTPDVSSTLTFSGGIFTNGNLDNDTYTMTYNVSDANVVTGFIDIQVTSGRDQAGNVQAEGNLPDAFNIVTTNPEIEITGLGIEVIDDDNTPSILDDTDFGDLLVSSGALSKTYTINNSGDGDLILGPDAVNVSGDTDFVVVVQPDQVVLTGGSSTFSIEFNAQSEGLRTAEVVITNNDEDENPYNFTIQGNGLVPTVSLTAPNGGEQIQQNTGLNISFSTENLGGNEIIAFDYSSDNGGNWTEIGSGAVSDLNGTFSLFLDSDIYPVGVDNLIRARNDAQALEAVSGGTFEILAGDPVVTISTIPSTGTSITVGVSNQIIYQYTYDVAVADATLTNVEFTLLGNATAAEFVAAGFKIYQSTSNDFSTATQLGTASYGNAGTSKLGFSLNETIAAESTRYFWVTASINAAGTNSNFNISNPLIDDFGFEVAIKNLQTTQGATFTIQELTSQQITLTSPVGGEQVVQNADFPITWTTSNFEGNETIVIEYSTDAGSNWNALGSNSSALLNGTYNWFVDEFNFNPGSNYRIRVRTENNTTSSESSSSFEVIIPDPTVSIFTLPISGKSLLAGSSGNIISQFRFDVTAASADVAGIVFRFQGSSTATDFETGGFKLFSNSVNNFNTATQEGDGVDYSNLTENHVTHEFSQSIERDGSVFYWLTADISVGATVSSFNTLLPVESDFGLGDANKNLFVSAGASFNIIASGSPSITMTSPEGGSTFEQGNQVNIGFNTSDFTGDPTLILEYSANGGSSWTFLSSNTISGYNGSFDWTTSAAQVSGDNYKIRLRTDDSSVIGESSGTFEIISPPKVLTLINPTNAGITVFQNSTYTINWSAQNFVGTETLIVEHSLDAGANYTVLSSGSVNMFAGKYNWFVGINDVSQGATHRIRVRTPDGTSVVESASNFTVAAPIPPALSLQSPNAGTVSIEQNSTFDITWQASNFIGTENLFVEYSNDGGVEWSVIKTGTVAGLNGKINWFADNEIYEAGNQYQIRVRTSNNSLVSASPTFAITAPEVATISILSPNGGEIYEQKSTHNISFVTTGISRTRSIVIEYSINDGSSWAGIASGLVGQYEGNYNWFIDQSKYVVGNSYKIRVRTQDGTTEGISDAFFSIIEPRPVLTLLNPNGSEKIKRNSTFNISWNSLNFQGTETLVIEYSKDGGLSNDWFFIAQGTVSAFAGKYDWFINPATYTVGSQYKVRVRNTSSTALDASDQNFQIVPEVVKSIVVTYPNGGEQIEQNSTQVIKWNTTNFIGSENLVIEFTTSSTWQQLASGSASSFNGSLNWFIDNSIFGVNTNYQVRVRTMDSSVSDRSNELFSIVAPIAQALTMIAPSGGEQIEQNGTFDIRFSSTGFVGSDVLRLEYSNDGIAWNTIATNTVAVFGGTYNWSVDDFIYGARADYRIRIIDDASGLIISEGGIFEIVEPQVVSKITVSSPNTNEQLALYSNYEIAWSTVGIPDSETLIIEYSSDGGFSGWDFLASGTVVNLKGQYNWFVDEAIYDLGISNKIRVRTADDAVSDDSDDFFEIISPDRVAFNILSPNGGEVIQQNTTVDILFNTLGLEDDETIVLEYSTDGFNWTNLAATTVILFNGKFSWYIDPTVFFPHQRYRVRVRNINSSAIDESDNLFSIIEEIVPELTLTALLGGEQIEQNSTQTITWDESSISESENINIDYSVDGGNNWLNLTTASANELNGEYVWYVDAATFAVGINYKVRVQINNGAVSSESEQPFEVVVPVSLTLNLTSPNGGEQIQQNGQYSIKFNSFGLDASQVIDIEWSTDGTNWNNIASNTVAGFNGSFSWFVDDATYTIGPDYLIRVQNVANTLQDQSDAVFEVIAQKSITLLNPNGGEKLNQNRNFTISYNTTGLAGDTQLVIEYSVNGGLFWNPLTDGTVSSLSGNYEWFVDRALFKASNTYSIRVRTDDSKVMDVSNALFSVIAPVATFANQVEPFGFTANWNKYPGATSYLLDVSTSKSFDTFLQGYESLSTTELSSKITGLYHDTKYYYRVRANVAPDFTSANSNEITVKLPVSAELKADSLLLTNVYMEANGENWTNKGQWLQGKVKDWYGVTFSGGSITALDLSGNNLSGSFPDISSGFNDLVTVNISNNLLTSVADLSSLTTEGSLTTLDITLNKLDFAALDAIADIRVNSAYSFNPQGLLLEDTVIVAESTSSIELNRLVGGTDNQYQWYKDGVEVVGGVDPELGIVPLTFLIYKIHDGVYHVEVTNPAYAGITLETNPVQLRVSSLERDSLALLSIYDAMGGANWTGTVIGWRRDNRRVGDWTGVVDAGNRITGLNLPGRGVINDLPSDIRDITQIKSVDLSGNAITGLPDMTSLKKIESINVSGNKLEFDDFERNLDHLSKMVIGTQNPFGPAVDPVKIKAGVDYPISVKIGGKNNVYEWERKAHVLYGNPASFEVQANEVGATVVLENLRFDNMGTYRCRITNPKVPGLTLVSNETQVIGTVDLQGRVYDNNGDEVNEGDIGMMVIRDLNTRYDSLVNPSTGQPVFKVGLDGYIIRDVPLGDYLIGVRSDPTKFIQTYYVSQYEWLAADTLSLRDKKGKLNINITNIPVPDPGNFGDGTFAGVFEEDDGLDDGRTLGRRRLKGKGCVLKRRRGSGRGDADEIFDLYAYVETNDNGEFVFEELIPGTYRFNIEFPGIPMDEDSFTEFVVSGDLREANTFTVLATATPEGVIHVGLNEILSIHKEYFGELIVYPNPAKNKLTINYDKLTSTGVYARVVDLFGNVLLDQEIINGFNQKTELDISGIRNGMYILNFIDTNEDNLIISTSKVIISR